MARRALMMEELGYTDKSSQGEWELVSTMLKQIITDYHSPNLNHRYDVERFLSDGGLEYWAHFLGLGDGFVTAMEDAIQRPRTPYYCHTHGL